MAECYKNEHRLCDPRRKMRGFTLVEIIMVMILVGVLVVIALPKFIDMTSSSNQVEVDAIAEALTAVSAKNYSLSLSGSPDAFTVNNCTDVSQGLPPGHSMPGGFTVSSIAVGTHARVTCTVTHTDAVSTANFVAVGT